MSFTYWLYFSLFTKKKKKTKNMRQLYNNIIIHFPS